MVGTPPSKSDCVAYWALEDLTDKSGNGHTLSNSGATSGATGIIDDAYSFVTNDFMTTPYSDFITVAGSISLWFKKSTDLASQAFFSLGDTNANKYFWVYARNTGYVRFNSYDGVTAHNAEYQVDICDGDWHHLVWTNDGSNNKYYVDGVDVTSVIVYVAGSDGGTWTNDISGLDNVNLGRLSKNSAPSMYLDGSLDEVSYFSVALSSDNVTFLYNGGSPDSSQQYPFTTFTIVSPNGGESYAEGRYRDISWSDSGSVANVKLEYSDDNGGSYVDVESSVSNDGLYNWLVPSGVTAQALVRVSDVLDSSNNDVSDAVFGVVVAPNIDVSGGGYVVQSWLNLIVFSKLMFGNIVEFGNRQLRDWGFLSPHVQVASGDFSADVVRVHDGDTITLRTGWRDFDFPLRLAGVDAPEMNEGGIVARDWLRRRLLGRRVLVSVDPKNRVGKYGRLIGRVYHLGLCVNDELVNRGLAASFGSKNIFDVPPISKLLFKHEVGF